MDDRGCPEKGQGKQDVYVLVPVHADGFLEGFATDCERVRVHIRFVDVPRAPGAAGEIAAEDYIAATIPQKYRDIYFPGNRRAVHMPRLVTAQTIAERNHALELLRAIQDVGRVPDEPAQTGKVEVAPRKPIDSSEVNRMLAQCRGGRQ